MDRDRIRSRPVVAGMLRVGGAIVFVLGVLTLPCFGLTALLSLPDRALWTTAVMVAGPLALIAGGAWAVFAGTSIIPPKTPAKRCPQCDYDLTGRFASDGCPECGWGREHG